MDDAGKSASERLERLLTSSGREIEQISPNVALEWVEQGGLIIDIREPHELVSGTAAGARLISRGMLELEIGSQAPKIDKPLVLMCAGGDRSRLSAASLKHMGYERVASMQGGFDAWRQSGLPVEQVENREASRQTRYLRHLSIAEVGEAGQQRLAESCVLIVGAGGLGSPAALYLAAAGVGRLVLVDDDRVERSNLQRQILHSDHLIGHLKTESAAQRLHALNPDIRIETHTERISPDNAAGLLETADVVIDGSDNFPTRYLLNEICVRLEKPLVYGAVLRFTGQVAVFDGRVRDAACYQCLFPEPPRPEDAPNCAEAGVLGVMPGVIGSLQATETLKLLLKIGHPLVNRLLRYDALKGEFSTTRLVRDPQCPTCGN